MKTLLEHRQELAINPAAYTEDLPRTARTLVTHLKKAGYRRISAGTGIKERQEFVRLIFRAQMERPFYHIEAPLPYCWNSPQRDGWTSNYIKYEWGHLQSINQNRNTAFSIENLALMSARCNQHIQSSMNVEELLTYGGMLEATICRNLAARQELFAGAEWKSLVQNLEHFK